MWFRIEVSITNEGPAIYLFLLEELKDYEAFFKEQWSYVDEFVFISTMDEKGEKITKIVEFVESSLFAKYHNNLLRHTVSRQHRLGSVQFPSNHPVELDRMTP